MTAIIWFLLSVYPLVFCNIFLLTKIFVTWLHYMDMASPYIYIYMLWCSTILWFHINMSHWLLRYVFSSVCFQWCFTRFFFGEKTIVILAAQIWFLRSVYPVVLYQLLIPSKSFFTFTAVIWFLPSVFHVVLCQFLLLCKTFVTLATDI